MAHTLKEGITNRPSRPFLFSLMCVQLDLSVQWNRKRETWKSLLARQLTWTHMQYDDFNTILSSEHQEAIPSGTCEPSRRRRGASIIRRWPRRPVGGAERVAMATPQNARKLHLVTSHNDGRVLCSQSLCRRVFRTVHTPCWTEIGLYTTSCCCHIPSKSFMVDHTKPNK